MALYTRELSCTLDELWCLHRFMRFPASAPDYSHEVDRQLALDIFHGITELTPQQQQYFALWITDEQLWWASRLVSPDYMVGTRMVGLELLARVMRLLWEAEREEAYDDLSSESGVAADGSGGGAHADAHTRTGDNA